METPNLSYINTLSGGDKAFENKIIDIIKNEFPKEKEIYLENIKSEKFKETAENVHKIKHKITILGLENSYVIANNFEESLKEGSLEGKEDFEAILNTITEFLLTL